MDSAESENIEFKKSTSELKEALVSIVAILNKHQKGVLYFGRDNLGREVKNTYTEKTLREISHRIAEIIEPKIYPKIEMVNNSIKVSFEGDNIPYFANGRAYIRTADEDRTLSLKEIEEMVLKKSAKKWDSRLSDEEVNDIDDKTLINFIKKANYSARLNFSFSNNISILNKLNLTQEGKLTNAAHILFSKNEPVEVQAGVFAGTTKKTFLDIKQYKGNIMELIPKCEAYIFSEY